MPEAVGARRPARPRRAPGLQDRRHLRGRVPRADAVPLLELRRRDRGRAARAAGKVVILGSGPNRIGQGVEFDYSCVHACFALRDAGYETIMVNCNPETVSTDYDTSDRLYFEPLTLEDVLEVVHAESRPAELVGVIVQLGGQTPLGLAQGAQGRRRADPRHHARGDRPRRGPRRVRPGPRRGRPAAPRSTARRPTLAEAVEVAEEIGYPVLVRPSLRARRARHGDRLRRRDAARTTSSGRPTAIARAPGAGRPVPRRRDRDRRRRALRRHRALPRRRHGAHRGGRHPLRRLGLHPAAGDARARRASTGCASATAQAIAAGRRRARPAQRAVRARRRTCSTCSRRTRGPVRTVPFVVQGAPASRSPRRRARIMVGATHRRAARRGHAARASDGVARAAGRADRRSRRRCCRSSGSAPRRATSSTRVLGPEMRSTGEVMGIDADFPTRVRQEPGCGATAGCPTEGTVFVSVADRDKRAIIFPVKRLAELGFDDRWRPRAPPRCCAATAIAADGRAQVQPRRRRRRRADDRRADQRRRDRHGGQHARAAARARADGYEIRPRPTTAMDVPIITTVQQLAAAVQGIEALRPRRPRRHLAAGRTRPPSTSAGGRAMSATRVSGRRSRCGRGHRHPPGRRLPPPDARGARRRRARPARPVRRAGRRRPDTGDAAAPRRSRSTGSARGHLRRHRRDRRRRARPGHRVARRRCAPTTRSTSSARSAGRSRCRPSRCACVLVGGGYGSAPLFWLAEALRERGCRVDFVLGAATEDRLFGVLEAKRMPPTASRSPPTTAPPGSRGRVTDVLPRRDRPHRRRGRLRLRADGDAARGHEVAAAHGAVAQVAVEESMACGVGVCMTCVCRSSATTASPGWCAPASRARCSAATGCAGTTSARRRSRRRARATPLGALRGADGH